MAALTKLTVTRWIDPQTKSRVPANTPGAKKVKDKTDHFYIVDKTGGKVVRTNTHCTDRKAAQAALTDYHRKQERGEQGLTDPRKKHLDKAIGEHVAEYMGTLARRSATHRTEVQRVLKLATKGMKTLKDFTTEAITAYLNRTSSAATGNKHRAYLSGLSNYVYRMDYTGTNPIDRVDRLKPGHAEPESRTRRPYTEDELRRLMTAARTYPLVTRGQPSRGGRPRRDGTPAQHNNPTQLSDSYRAKLVMQGRERELVYRLSLATGLRRGELSRVTVAMFNGNKLLLPKSILKHRPKYVTHVIIPIVPALAADLSAYLKDSGKQPGDKLVNVPTKCNYIREHKARLRLASIPYLTEFGHADIHALRTTANHYLKKNNVPLDVRQRYMRHSAKDVTSKHYDPDNRRPITMTKRVYFLLNELDKLITRTPPTPT